MNEKNRPQLNAITLDISGLDLNIPLQIAQYCSNGAVNKYNFYFIP